jgi:hypothetical protein
MEPRQSGPEVYEEPRLSGPGGYEPPQLRVLGAVFELTQQGCQKQLGGSDGFLFQGTHLVCTSP